MRVSTSRVTEIVLDKGEVLDLLRQKFENVCGGPVNVKIEIDKKTKYTRPAIVTITPKPLGKVITLNDDQLTSVLKDILGMRVGPIYARDSNDRVFMGLDVYVHSKELEANPSDIPAALRNLPVTKKA